MYVVALTYALLTVTLEGVVHLQCKDDQRDDLIGDERRRCGHKNGSQKTTLRLIVWA